MSFPLTTAEEAQATILIAKMWRGRVLAKRRLGCALGLCLSGLRSIEARNARRSDLNPRAATLYVRTAKRGPNRILSLDPEFASALASLPRPAGSPYLLTNPAGNAIRDNGFMRNIRRWLHANVGPYSAHSLRHTAAMRVYEHTGYDVVAVQHFLGHRYLTSTMRYLRAHEPHHTHITWPPRYSPPDLALLHDPLHVAEQIAPRDVRDLTHPQRRRVIQTRNATREANALRGRSRAARRNEANP